jgi:hypothetical protein
MNSAKRDGGHKLDHRPSSGEVLKNQRMAQEQAKKDAGTFGELSIGVIEHGSGVFVYTYKGVAESSMHRLAAKRPKEISKPDHEALCLWLKAGGYDGFKHRIAAWNLSADEAARVKQATVEDLTGAGARVVNPVA